MKNIFQKKQVKPLVSIDIGSSSIKVMELDLSGEKPKLVSVGVTPTPANAINNHIITKPDAVAAAISSLLTANGINAQKAIVGIPGPCSFTKKIQMPAVSPSELAANISFEASNYIPHRVDAVHLDYQVLDVNERNSMNVLLVAVKNEIIRSFSEAVSMAGLEPVIADIDYFALENMFELNYAEHKKKTVALINIGAKYSSVNILQDGKSLFTGDVAVGGRLYTDALCETLQIEPLIAERAKMGQTTEGFDESQISETIDRTTEHVASEIFRQLGFFWNAAASDKSIETILISGGGAQVKGLLEALISKTQVDCQIVDALKEINCDSGIDSEYLAEIKPFLGVSVGLACRRLGDKPQVLE